MVDVIGLNRLYVCDLPRPAPADPVQRAVRPSRKGKPENC
jgi:hypothetical protein